MLIDFLFLITLVCGVYHVGIDTSVQMHIYPSWLLVEKNDFRKIRDHYEKNLFLFFYLPGLIEAASLIILLLFSTEGVTRMLLSTSLFLLALNFLLSYFLWAKWQQRVSHLDLGPGDDLVKKIVRTNWIRTSLIVLNGLVLVAGVGCRLVNAG